MHVRSNYSILLFMFLANVNQTIFLRFLLFLSLNICVHVFMSLY